jgi:predicted Zn-dependent protease
VQFSEIKSRKVKTRFVRTDDYEYYGKTKGEHVDLKEQIEAKSLMENYIKNVVPDSAVGVIGITEHDLFLPDMNYIFGVSYLKNRIGIVSSFRIANDWDESKSNIRKVVTKQIANLFSISNVKDYYCVLNYHDDLNKLRNGVSYISPKALEKLSYSIKFDVEKRFRELKDFHRKEKNEQMAEYYEQCLKLMKERKQETK